MKLSHEKGSPYTRQGYKQERYAWGPKVDIKPLFIAFSAVATPDKPRRYELGMWLFQLYQ